MSAQKIASVWFDKVDRWEISGCLYLNAYCRKKAINRFFAGVSRLGDGVIWYATAAILPLLYGREGLEVSLLLVGTLGICALTYKQLKNRLSRERPFIHSSEIYKGTVTLDRYSFPSGHTMHAVCFTTVALYYYPELAVMLLPFTLLVALSRVILGLHYPTDVLCGAALGILIGSASNYYGELGYLAVWI